MQQQRRLADARLAAEQDERAGHDAAAEHAIELVDAGRQARVLLDLDVGVELRAPPPSRRARSGAPAAAAPALGRLPRAPRRASSTRRSRRSGPATSATARRTPGRRRRSWDAWPYDIGSIGQLSNRVIDWDWAIGFGDLLDRLPITNHSITRFSTRRRTPARSAMPIRHTISHGIVPIVAAISRTSMRSSPCDADDHDFVAGRDVQAGDVGHQHVHAHRADDRRAAAADQHRAAAREPQVEAVGVAGRNDGDRRRPLGREPHAVADALAGAHALHRDDPARRASSTGVQRIVDASGGGTMP